jgi:starch phosphorylase
MVSTATFHSMMKLLQLCRNPGLDVGRAVIEGDDNTVNDKFYLRTATGEKIKDAAEQEALRSALTLLLSSKSTTAVKSRPKFVKDKGSAGILMGGFLASKCQSLFAFCP